MMGWLTPVDISFGVETASSATERLTQNGAHTWCVGCDLELNSSASRAELCCGVLDDDARDSATASLGRCCSRDAEPLLTLGAGGGVYMWRNAGSDVNVIRRARDTFTEF